jgi:hypothetical protein
MSCRDSIVIGFAFTDDASDVGGIPTVDAGPGNGAAIATHLKEQCAQNQVRVVNCDQFLHVNLLVISSGMMYDLIVLFSTIPHKLVHQQSLQT